MQIDGAVGTIRLRRKIKILNMQRCKKMQIDGAVGTYTARRKIKILKDAKMQKDANRWCRRHLIG